MLSGESQALVFSARSPGNMVPVGILFVGLIFTTTKNLDREAQARYEIVVEARDAQGLRGESSTATVLVTLLDINDNFPIFTQSESLPEGPEEGGSWDAPDSVTWELGEGSPESLYFSPNPRVGLRPREVIFVLGGALFPIPAHIPKAVLRSHCPDPTHRLIIPFGKKSLKSFSHVLGGSQMWLMTCALQC